MFFYFVILINTIITIFTIIIIINNNIKINIYCVRFRYVSLIVEQIILNNLFFNIVSFIFIMDLHHSLVIELIETIILSFYYNALYSLSIINSISTSYSSICLYANLIFSFQYTFNGLYIIIFLNFLFPIFFSVSV